MIKPCSTMSGSWGHRTPSWICLEHTTLTSVTSKEALTLSLVGKINLSGKGVDFDHFDNRNYYYCFNPNVGYFCMILILEVVVLN